MKYKEGDKVRVRRNLEVGGRYQMEDIDVTDTFVATMCRYLGKVVTIHSIDGPKYRINEDNGKHMWTDEMFELPIVRITKVIYNPPATIVWFNDGDKVVSKAEEGDEFDWETGLAICVLKKRVNRRKYNRLQPYFFEGEPPLWDVLVRMECPNGEWEKIKKEWKQK